MPQSPADFATFKNPRHSQAREKARFLEGMFSSISPSYDRLNRLLSFRFDVSWRKQLVRESGLRAGEQVLDVCTGTGDVLLEFGRRVPGCRGTGLDFSAGMLERARLKPGAASFAWRRGDALKLPFKAGSFQCACMAFGLRNVVDIVKAFREMGRVVQPGRKVLSLELTRPSHPLMKALYLPYLHFYLPVVGRLVSGNGQAYAYLRDSIEGFFTPAQVLAFMWRAGLKDCRAIPLSGGIARLYVGTVKGRRK